MAASTVLRRHRSSTQWFLSRLATLKAKCACPERVQTIFDSIAGHTYFQEGASQPIAELTLMQYVYELSTQTLS
jgi:hypothetical protein